MRTLRFVSPICTLQLTSDLPLSRAFALQSTQRICSLASSIHKRSTAAFRGSTDPQTFTGRTLKPSSTKTALSMSSETPSAPPHKFVDIGANLLDERFTEGSYFGRKKHEPDWDAVMERAESVGVSHIILTAGTLHESRRALDLTRELRGKSMQFGCTVGVHPTRCQQEFVDADADAVLSQLADLVRDGMADGSVVALGEIGLDYDRLEFCSKEVQQAYLAKQLEIFRPFHRLPLFLHNRSVNRDLLDVLKKEESTTKWKGVVHSFDDTLELAQAFIEMGFYIGLNGCSLKTEDNLQVVRELPLDKILLETDCPYCEIKQTHAGFHHVQTKFQKKPDKKFELGKMVKGRNEPCQIIQVAEVIAGVKGVDVAEVASICHRNSLALYGWS